ncbi:MAG: hypothetical protein AMXMBFR58_29080 [Phycisphaerae bacterium]
MRTVSTAWRTRTRMSGSVSKSGEMTMGAGARSANVGVAASPAAAGSGAGRRLGYPGSVEHDQTASVTAANRRTAIAVSGESAAIANRRCRPRSRRP